MENPQNATWSCGDVFESACSLFHDYQSTRNNRKHADADAELEDRLRGQLRTFVKEVQRNEAYLGFSSPTVRPLYPLTCWNLSQSVMVMYTCAIADSSEAFGYVFGARRSDDLRDKCLESTQ
eukprot:gb/GECG01000584.1/.p1 GENE.gb/GECG01000584.1/~~gb/GECG01000584.1/.p1  ORF type:complete len:122 (+),score=15.49 gb/GECG01000584.1/:1-366(+)